MCVLVLAGQLSITGAARLPPLPTPSYGSLNHSHLLRVWLSTASHTSSNIVASSMRASQHRWHMSRLFSLAVVRLFGALCAVQ